MKPLAGLTITAPLPGDWDLGTADQRLRNWMLFWATEPGDRVWIRTRGEAAQEYVMRHRMHGSPAAPAESALDLYDPSGAHAGRLLLRPSRSRGYYTKNPTHYRPGLDYDLELRLGRKDYQPWPDEKRKGLADLVRIVPHGKPRKRQWTKERPDYDHPFRAAETILAVDRLVRDLPRVEGLEYAGHNAWTFGAERFYLEPQGDLGFGPTLSLSGGSAAPMRSKVLRAFQAVYPERDQVSVLDGGREGQDTIHIAGLPPPPGVPDWSPDALKFSERGLSPHPEDPFRFAHGMWRTVAPAVPARLWHRRKPGGDFWERVPTPPLPPFQKLPPHDPMIPAGSIVRWRHDGGVGPVNVGILEIRGRGNKWVLSFRHGTHGTPGPGPSRFDTSAGPAFKIGTYPTALEAKLAGLAWLEADPDPIHAQARESAARKAKPTGKLTKAERALLELARKAKRQGVMASDQLSRVAERLKGRGMLEIEDDLVGEPKPQSAGKKRPGIRAYLPALELVPLRYAARNAWKDHARKRGNPAWPPPPGTFA